MKGLEKLRTPTKYNPAFIGTIDINFNDPMFGEGDLYAILKKVELDTELWYPLGICINHDPERDTLFLICIERGRYHEDERAEVPVTAFQVGLTLNELLTFVKRFHIVCCYGNIPDNFVLSKKIHRTFEEGWDKDIEEAQDRVDSLKDTKQFRRVMNERIKNDEIKSISPFD